MGLNYLDDVYMLQVRLFRLAQTRTGKMLFDETTDMWMNGPDYIADEYRREIMALKRKRKSQKVHVAIKR